MNWWLLHWWSSFWFRQDWFAGPIFTPNPIGVDPTNGDIAGGYSANIYNLDSSFQPGDTVTFGGVPVPITSLTPTSIHVVVPVHAAGFADIVVTDPTGTIKGTLTNGFLYTNFGPITMPGQITVIVNMRITNANGNLQEQTQPTSYQATMVGERGPTPGSLHVPLSGIDANFSELVVPGGLCWLINIDTNGNFCTYGIFDHTFNRFYPLGELLPGQPTLFRLSRFLGTEYGTGSGTVGHGDTIRFYAVGAPVDIVIKAFDA